MSGESDMICDVVVVNWTNEEGTRFTPGCTGSGVWAGELNLEEIYRLEDRQGFTLAEALNQKGFMGDTDFQTKRLHAAFEMHIEQGPVLDHHKISIGIPKGIVCLRWYDIEIKGEANHAGTTPMDTCHDALYVFASITGQIRWMAVAANKVVATVGECQSFGAEKYQRC